MEQINIWGTSLTHVRFPIWQTKIIKLRANKSFGAVFSVYFSFFLFYIFPFCRQVKPTQNGACARSWESSTLNEVGPSTLSWTLLPFLGKLWPSNHTTCIGVIFSPWKHHHLRKFDGYPFLIYFQFNYFTPDLQFKV